MCNFGVIYIALLDTTFVGLKLVIKIRHKLFAIAVLFGHDLWLQYRTISLNIYSFHYSLFWQTVKVETRDDWLTRSGTVPHNVHLMVASRVKEEAQKHFNCSTLEGAELENQGGKGTELAHWEKRLFGNEGMTGIFTQNAVFSRLTLALMEDTGLTGYSFSCKIIEDLRI